MGGSRLLPAMEGFSSSYSNAPDIYIGPIYIGGAIGYIGLRYRGISKCVYLGPTP